MAFNRPDRRTLAGTSAAYGVLGTALLTLVLASCTDGPAAVAADREAPLPHASLVEQADGRFLVVFAGERVPADFPERVSGLGGAVETALDAIGVAVVTALTESAAAELAAQDDVQYVEPDMLVTMSDDEFEAADAVAEEIATEALAPADPVASPTLARFYPRQWNMRAVFTDRAWSAGHLGSRDVVVAILDTGIDYLHPDLMGLVDLERSTSFVPEDDPLIAEFFPGRLPISDLYWHGTAAASIVASNATLLSGVNRHVTLLAIKIANSRFETSPARILAGIVYAAEQGADVINISNGRERDRSENPGIAAAFERAVNYAFRKGALVVTVAFNDGADLDQNGDKARFPCEAANAICVSATGPTGADGVNGPWQNVDARAPYSAFGRSAIDVAAPGGAGEPGQFRRIWLPCTTSWVQHPAPPGWPPACRLPVCRTGVCMAQGQGTSWAAPHVAGLAALLVARLGHGNPALIRSRILESADDLGEPGLDPYYGHGRINIARALGVID